MILQGGELAEIRYVEHLRYVVPMSVATIRIQLLFGIVVVRQRRELLLLIKLVGLLEGERSELHPL